MKTKKKIALTALSAILVGSLVSGTVVAFAHEDTQGHEFNNKFDVVWENFDKDDDDFYKVVDRTTTTGTVELGEKPYFHVVYDNTEEGRHADQAGSGIYKQGLGGYDAYAQTAGNTLNFVMRSPDESVKLEDLQLGLRENGSGDNLAVQNFAQLQSLDSSSKGTFAQEYGETIDSDWETYTLAFGPSYSNVNIDGSTLKITDQTAKFVGLHLYTVAEAVGTLDIACIYLVNTAGDVTMLNNFMGGDTALETAQDIAPTTWWATKPGEGVGEIVKRQPAIKGEGSFTVNHKDAPINDYKYAVIETAGDAAGLKVSTTKDNGTTWSTPVDYDGSVMLEGGETGFKFENTGAETVKVTRIYLTNLFSGSPATAVPVIDAATVDVLDSFTIAQKDISGDYDAMCAASSVKAEGLQYRLSYTGPAGDKQGDPQKADPRVEIKDGSLVVDMDKEAPGAADGYVNVKIHSLTAHEGKFIVFKMKAEDGANLQSFRFGIMPGTDDSPSGEKWYKDNQLKAGFDFVAPGLDASNPYKDGDWYYLVIDIEESGFPASENGYSGVNLYFGGEGKLSIDAIFFADEAPAAKIKNFENKTDKLELDVDNTDMGAVYLGYIYAPDTELKSNRFAFDVTPKTDDFDISSLRLEFGGVGFFWASENAEGTLITEDGQKLSELTYEKDKPTHVVIDLEASGVKKGWEHMFAHGNKAQLGNFYIDNYELYTVTRASEVKAPAEEVELDNEVNFTPSDPGYQYVTGIELEPAVYSKLEFTFTAGADYKNGFRVAVHSPENPDSNALTEINPAAMGDKVITADGKTYAEIDLSAGPVTYVFDLAELGIEGKIAKLHMHSNGVVNEAGTDGGAFQISGIKLTTAPVIADSVLEAYAEQMTGIAAALNVDRVAPIVTISTSNKATVGDTVEIKHTATDDKTAAANLTVKYEVVDEEGNAVTVTGGKFTAAAEGVYTVTVYVTDEAGNEGNDVLQITVTKATTPGDDDDNKPGGDDNKPGGDENKPGGDENKPVEDKKDEETNLTWLWVLLGIVGGCGIGVGIYFLVKKLRNKKN